jgi:hypothetical protein
MKHKVEEIVAIFIKSIKIIPKEDLPLYIGWPVVFPLLAELISNNV